MDFLCKLFFVYHLIILCYEEEKWGLDCYVTAVWLLWKRASDHMNLEQTGRLIS